MPLPALERQRVDAALQPFCAARAHPRRRLDYRVRGNSVTLFELVPPLHGQSTEWVDIVVAQFRFDPVRLSWALYCADRNSRWHPYLEAPPSKHFRRLLDAVVEDVTCIFWG